MLKIINYHFPMQPRLVPINHHRMHHVHKVDTVSPMTLRYFIYHRTKRTSDIFKSKSGDTFQSFSVTPPREFSPPKFTNRKNLLDDEIVAYIDRSLHSYKDANAYKQRTERYNSSNDLDQFDYYEQNRHSSNVDDFDRVGIYNFDL